MHTVKLIFAQVIGHLPPMVFEGRVARYSGNRKIQSFTCMDQYLCMAFAQLTFRESLRVIEACLRSQTENLYPEHTSPEERVSRGWWPMPVSQKKPDGTYARLFAVVGCAVGGSSIHYAAALERMPATDFQALTTEKGRTSGWPITYEELVPFYEAAEKLYRVKTILDSALDSAAMSRLSDWDKAMMDNLRRRGLQPDVLHVAMDYDASCLECTGRICPRGCKADAMSACLEEAQRQRALKDVRHPWWIACTARTLSVSASSD